MKKNVVATFGVAVAVATAGLGINMQTAYAQPAPKKANFTKTLTVNTDEYLPAFTFNFSISQPSDLEMNAFGGKAMKGPEGLVSVAGPIQFDQVIDKLNQDTTKTSTGALTVDVDQFKTLKPGIYVYKLTETQGTFEAVHYDKNAYNFFVQVTSAGEVNYWFGTIDGKAEPNFENSYTHKDKDNPPTDEKYTHNLEITKVLAGNAFDKNDEFEFQIEVLKASNEGDVYTVTTQKGTAKTEASVALLGKVGQKVTVKINGGDKIFIKGVTAGDQLKVTELNGEGQGYTVEYKDGQQVQTDGISHEFSADGSATVTNTKNTSAPTGLLLEYGPFVLMIAAAGTLVAVSKKRIQH